MSFSLVVYIPSPFGIASASATATPAICFFVIFQMALFLPIFSFASTISSLLVAASVVAPPPAAVLLLPPQRPSEVTMFSVYCERKFEVEPVEVIYPNGKSYVCPDLSLYQMVEPLSYITGAVGVILPAHEILFGRQLSWEEGWKDNMDMVNDCFGAMEAFPLKAEKCLRRWSMEAFDKSAPRLFATAAMEAVLCICVQRL
ncbi:hypothetical protein BUALT_Bualt07G0107500 [Buddleja alternifolia]|uniref:Uncharacterized protein n=1 Tax=Buddleja alternifolia TaxID=168488 RepID=A0AAV6XB18_9LAMI|nr:hypothetical protein BUALT_Bualt07G0107500 [Buddleja alternifolia]